MAKKIKPTKSIIFSNILGIIGFCIFYFAPGNSARMSTITEFSGYSFVEKIFYRVPSIFKHLFDIENSYYTSLPFFVLLFISLLVCYGLYAINEHKSNKLLKICTAFLGLYLMIVLCISLNIPGISSVSKYFVNFVDFKQHSYFSFLALFQYLYHFLIIISSFILSFYISKYEDENVVLVYGFVAFFAQGIMVMAPASEYRTVFISIIFIIVSIVSLFNLCYKKKISILHFGLLPLVLIYTDIIFIVLLLLALKAEMKYKIINGYTIVMITLLILSFFNYTDVQTKYYENRLIWEANMNILKNYVSGDVYLYESKYSGYQFCGMNISWIVDEYRKLYDIPESANFYYYPQEETESLLNLLKPF